MLDEAVLGALAVSLKYPDPAEIVGRARDLVFGQLQAERERVMSEMVAARIEHLARMFDAKTRGQSALADAVTALFANIQVGELWNTAEGAVSNAIGKQDYAAVLRLFNNKGLVNQVSSLFGLQPKGLREYFLRSLQSGDAAVISAVRNRAPKIPALH